jgi:hypothetical protein
MIALGCFLAWMGLQGIRQHILWVAGYNFRLGTFEVMPVVALVGLGAVFALLGVLSLRWPR